MSGRPIGVPPTLSDEATPADYSTYFRDRTLANCGYECEVSDKGRYESETIRKFGGIEGAGYAVRHSQTSLLLKEFLSKKGPIDGVHDEGVYLSDKRRYLNFACI